MEHVLTMANSKLKPSLFGITLLYPTHIPNPNRNPNPNPNPNPNCDPNPNPNPNPETVECVGYSRVMPPIYAPP